MRRTISIELITLAGLATAVWAAGWYATRPANEPIGQPPEDRHLN